MNNTKDVLNIIKKNSWWYILTMLITSATVVGTVVISKQTLPPNFFIQFNLQLSAIVLINNVAMAWFSQSLNRFIHQFSSSLSIATIFKVALWSLAVASLPIFFIWRWYIQINENPFLPVIFLVLNALYGIVLIAFQAKLKVKEATQAEGFRNACILIGFLLVFPFSALANTSYFWMLNISATCIALLVLLLQWNKKIIEGGAALEPISLKKLLHFGLPLSLWLLLAFLLINVDRWYTAKLLVPIADVAALVALADLIQRGVGFAFSPIVSASYPLLAKLYDDKNGVAVAKLIDKVLLFELAVAVVGLTIFSFSSKLIFSLLHIKPVQENIFKVGIVFITAQVLWQMCGMMQKASELQLQTKKMVIGLFVAVCITFLVLYVIYIPATIFETELICLSGILVYTFFCAWNYKHFKTKLLLWK